MSNLLASLRASGDALAVFQEALGTIQNNIDNSSTPGYAKQQVNLVAQPFDVAGGLAGGVAARGLDDSRNQFAEEEVRRQVNALGRLDAQSQAVSSIEKLFDVSGTTGLPAALTQLFSSFSAWSVDPNGTSARQTVLDSAGQFADQVRGLAGSLNSVSQNLDQQIASTVQQVNSLAGQVQQYNVQRRNLAQPDPGLDAQVNSSLEQLAQLADFTAVRQNDGTITVLTGGGTAGDWRATVRHFERCGRRRDTAELSGSSFGAGSRLAGWRDYRADHGRNIGGTAGRPQSRPAVDHGRRPAARLAEPSGPRSGRHRESDIAVWNGEQRCRRRPWLRALRVRLFRSNRRCRKSQVESQHHDSAVGAGRFRR